MKGRSFLNALSIFLGFVAATAFCFSPALADDGQGMLEEEQEPAIEVEIDDGAADTLDDSFGQISQATWLPSSDFTPYNSTTVYNYATPGLRYITAGSPYMDAGVRLPSGARLTVVRMFYDDNHASSSLTLHIYKNRLNVSPFTWTDLVTVSSPSGVDRWDSNAASLNETIQNAQYWYQARIVMTGGSATKFAGVRLYWNRQIRPGLAHPFTDIGHLPQLWRDSIAALKASGITSGTTPTTYSPDANLTRGQMAVFLAKALGLYWSYSSGY